jgi:hypothetical protein
VVSAAGFAPALAAGGGVPCGHLLPSVDAALADGLTDLFNAVAPDNVIEMTGR